MYAPKNIFFFFLFLDEIMRKSKRNRRSEKPNFPCENSEKSLSCLCLRRETKTENNFHSCFEEFCCVSVRFCNMKLYLLLELTFSPHDVVVAI